MGRDEIDREEGAMPEADACETLAALLEWRARYRPGGIAYKFLHSARDGDEILTHGELDGRARGVAAKLTALGLAGERVLLLSPPGLDYIVGFFGCLYAGAVAVPVYPPRANRSIQRLTAIVAECDARAALTTERVPPIVAGGAAEAGKLAQIPWLLLDEIAAEPGYDAVRATRNDIAFLQYTSGSTSVPKGVIVSHGNLMRNSALIRDTFGFSTRSRGVLWLPPYHDMGLIGGILQTLFFGGPLALMSPASFLQKPLRWLQAISDERATVTAGPNFAYELCLRVVSEAERDTLDLSSLRTALCGSEPVRAATLERFADYFATAGFRRDAFYPCYGLAESTLIVSGRGLNDVIVTGEFDAEALSRDAAVPANGAKAARLLVSAGPAVVDRIEIVSRTTGDICLPGEIGEIWVRDASVAQGYWNRPEETGKTFRAYLPNGSGPFMRTGDLGFLSGGELFITGRAKDLIILRGRNHYPQDFEDEAAGSHEALRQSPCVAFSVDRGEEERLVLIHELPRAYRRLAGEQIAADVRRAIAQAFDVEVDTVVLVPPLGIPKTSSGKLERLGCRRAWLDGTLKTVGEYRRGAADPSSASSFAANTMRPRPTAPALQAWLVERLAAILQLSPARIDVGAPFSAFGLDSVQAVGISGELEAWLGRSLPATLLWDYPTIGALAQHLGAANGARAMPEFAAPPLRNGRAQSSGKLALRRTEAPVEIPDREIEQLNEDELGALLSRKLAEIGTDAALGCQDMTGRGAC